jgi:hypothetical protein
MKNGGSPSVNAPEVLCKNIPGSNAPNASCKDLYEKVP